MRNLFWLAEEQVYRIKVWPSTDIRGSYQGSISVVISVIRNGLRWKNASAAHGPHKNPYNHFRRYAEKAYSNSILPSWSECMPLTTMMILYSTHQGQSHHCHNPPFAQANAGGLLVPPRRPSPGLGLARVDNLEEDQGPPASPYPLATNVIPFPR